MTESDGETGPRRLSSAVPCRPPHPALAGEPLHGYGIMQEVLRQSGGRYNLGPGTLYDNL